MRGNPWNIVLAAGSGRRLASVTGGIPKQFWSSDDGPTLLEDTLARTAPLVPPERTIIVVDRTHASFVAESARLQEFDHIAFQPCDRGTAAGVLLGLTRVMAVDPEAVVMLTPSDHGVADPDMFVAELRQSFRDLQRYPNQCVLFGITPERPEGDYGWITHDTSAATKNAPRRVTGFVEKPPAHVARRLFEVGAVWNTMVMTARASALLDLYRRHLPSVLDAFMSALAPEGEDEVDGVHARYAALPSTDFSRDLLEVADDLLLRRWPLTLGWSDLGTPERLQTWREAQRRLPLAAAPRRAVGSLQPASYGT